MTLSWQAALVPILGCATYSGKQLLSELIEIIVDGRERTPLIATADTELAIVVDSDREVQFLPLCECRPNDRVVIPMPQADRMNLVAAPIRKVSRKTLTDVSAFTYDAGATLAGLRLPDRRRSYATLSGVVHV